MKKGCVFISHAGGTESNGWKGGDKPFIRPIIDHLIGAGFEIWFDRPQELGYSTEEISAHFRHITANDDWRVWIPDAIRKVDCTVFLASPNAVEKERKVLQEEVFVSFRTGKLLIAQFQPVDLGASVIASLDDRIVDRQRVFLDTFFSGPNLAFSHCERGRERLNLLVKEIEDMVRHRLDEHARNRYGDFAHQASRTPLTPELRNGLLSLLAHEQQVNRLLASPVASARLSASHDDLPAQLPKRLGLVDLPIAFGVDPTGNDGRKPDLAQRRIDCISDEDANPWGLIQLIWPKPEKGLSVDDALANIASQIERQTSRARRADAGNSPLARLAALLEGLEADCRTRGTGVLIWGETDDRFDAREMNEAILDALDPILAVLDPAHIQFHLTLTRLDCTSWDRMRQREETDAWLDKVSCRAVRCASARLGPLERDDLHIWPDMAALLLKRDAESLKEILEEAIASGGQQGKIRLRSLRKAIVAALETPAPQAAHAYAN